MKVGIIGSRNCKGFKIDSIDEYLPKDCDEIISGGAEGIDTYAEEIAKRKNIKFRKILPDYEKYNKRAPLERNVIKIRKK